jgi:hypothetical protein
MQIKQHDKSHIVVLSDNSVWRIWPGDSPKTLQWLSTTEIDVADSEDEICSHALVNRSEGTAEGAIVPIAAGRMTWKIAGIGRHFRKLRRALPQMREPLGQQ